MPCMATGITMAMNTKAASTSANVKAARRLGSRIPGAPEVGLMRNFIMHAIKRLDDGNGRLVLAPDQKLLDTAFVDRAVGLKPDHGQAVGQALAHAQFKAQ